MLSTWWRRKSLLGVAVGMAAISLVAFTACGDDDDDDGGDETPAAGASATPGTGNGDDFDYESLSGELSSDGSSTVFPISEAVAEEFGQASDVRVNVGLSGTGGGFERFCRGEIEVSAASRPIRDSEVQACIMGAQRMASLFERFGAETVEACFQAIIEKCRDTFRDELMPKIADGEYVWHDYVEREIEGKVKLHKIALKMTKAREKMRINRNEATIALVTS